MTTSFIQLREDAREEHKADRAEDWERDKQRETHRNEERAEERKIQAEERLATQNTFRMFLPMLINANQHLPPTMIQQLPNPEIPENDNLKRAQTGTSNTMDTHLSNRPPTSGGGRH